MTYKRINGFVISKRNIAALTPWSVATSGTYRNRGESPAINKNNTLLTPAKGFTDIFTALQSKSTIHLPLLAFTDGIHNFNFRHDGMTVTLGKRHKTVFACLCLIICVYGRSRAAEKHFRPMHPGKHHCRIACIIPRSRLRLLVGTVMLLIYNNEPKIFKWQEY